MILSLALCLCVQTKIADVQFIKIQEEFVIDSMPYNHRMRGYVPIFGERKARYLNMMACEHGDCREVALEHIRWLPPVEAFRMMVWASRSKDKHTAYVARNYVEGVIWYSTEVWFNDPSPDDEIEDFWMLRAFFPELKL